MANEELIKYLEESIVSCDKYKEEWSETNHNLSKIFEGMSEAYCDIYQKLTGESYDSAK